ncbi:hypothetical protein ACMU_04575 [Actibacterium mucosum KCTC 23349]|uniref:Uncharacterized protein n=1 Tax=Actibacterium mucosum KCTC 23349 TaxID=1454373 RepID=A0A037ZBY1_9RHOB|nr:tetratricopeptide repeat protein [Actibacterium mucosum]KAJ53984.1 hypothetical protein ACMU_04575 [Actibacterium mucosum KCTC 23349]
MRHSFTLIIAVALVLVSPAVGKPLLRHSQDTYAKACMDWNDSYERLVELCETALNEPGLSENDRLGVMDVLGWSHVELGDLARATEIYDEMLTIKPGNVDAFNALGWIEWTKEDFEAAAAHFGSSMARKPTAEALAGLAASRYNTGELTLDEAAAQLEAAVAIDPDYSWPLARLGWNMHEAGRFDEALSAFDRAIEIDEFDTWAWGGRAQTLRYRGEFQEALEAIQTSLEIDETSTWDIYERGLILFDLSRYKQAINDFDTTMKDWPDIAYVRVMKARALIGLGREFHALGVLERAEVDLGYDYDVLDWRAWLYSINGMREKALQDAEAMIAADETNAWAHERLGSVYIEFDENDKARAAYEKALELEENMGYSLFKLASLDVRDGALDEGEARMMKALEAGIDEANISEFVAELSAKFEYVRAVQFRVKARDYLAAKEGG